MRTHPGRRVTVTRALLALAVTAGISAATAATALADPSPSTWAHLRQCESSGNYRAVAANGHYGAYQFDLPTWRSVGGTGMPQHASRREQDYRALYLYRMRGWQPWECADRRHLNLTGDADAGSRDIPSRSDATSIAAGWHTPPPWDGKVYGPGDCSASLRTFQFRMNVLGSPYHFQGSGCYYRHTRTAVIALQRANGINPSGRLGPKTWRAAWLGTSPFS